MISRTMIYLASASPRRRELLRQLGVEFEAMPSNILEVRQERGESPADYACGWRATRRDSWPNW